MREKKRVYENMGLPDTGCTGMFRERKCETANPGWGKINLHRPLGEGGS